MYAFAQQKPQVSLARNHGQRDSSYKLHADVGSGDGRSRPTPQAAKIIRGICSKEMILSGPESLEGQKIREAQHEFSASRRRMLRERYIYFTARVNAAGPVSFITSTEPQMACIGSYDQ